MKKIINISCFKFTDDDWYGNMKLAESCDMYDYKTKLVEVSLKSLINDMFRVCVWGNDDFGMERDYHSLAEASDMFNKLLQMKVINQADLLNLEFIRA